MLLNVNGRAREVPEGATVGELLNTLGVPREGTAVAVNRTVIPRRSHEIHSLNSADQVEIIQAVGGG